MIPQKLTLRNFMPYRDNVPPLDFNGIRLASICGDNGSGKSALIDAITWALWGQTRAGARNHDSLIHSQQNEMQVEFDFKVGEQLCRVIRKHAKPKRRQASGQSSLDLFVTSPDLSRDSFKLISGDRITETQLKITDILHMDYDTFVNSAYLRQGHADQFTIADSADRKKVLANILGLSRYDELEGQAKGLARQWENKKTLAESAIKDIDTQLTEKPAHEDRLKEAENQRFTMEKANRDQEAQLNDLRQKREQLESKQQQLTQLEKHIAETTRALEHWHDRVKQHLTRIKDYETLISRRTDIEESYAQLITTRKLSEELNRKLALVSRLNQRKYELNRAIDRVQATIVTDHKLAEAEIGKLETASQKLPRLKTELEQMQTMLNQLAEEEELLKSKRQTEQQLRTFIHSMESDKTRLDQEIAEISEKLTLLATQTEAVCPLCERELGKDHRRLIEIKYTIDKRRKAEIIKTKQTELTEKQTELEATSSETLESDQRINKTKLSYQATATRLEQEILSAYQAVNKIAEEKSRLSEIKERLVSKNFAASEQAALIQLEDELTKLDYDSQQHKQVRHQLAGLEQWESPWRKLAEADRLISQEKEAVTKDEQETQELHRNLESNGQKRQELTVELSILPQVTTNLAQAEAAHQRWGLDLRQVQETIGSIRGRLEHLGQLDFIRKEKEKAMSQAATEEQTYHDLAKAFGKNGIQALLIEMALPELQDETNQLLAHMTDNRMHVKFETQRETKKGDVAETLEIQIADELGTRRYEMFSGGEAFRINFAIRIALSKLLARRAGAPLPTLIIDEGFGTQDNTGLEKLKEAITSIQDDFEKILVITHVEELRDAFPTRIEIVRTAEGSTLEISV